MTTLSTHWLDVCDRGTSVGPSLLRLTGDTTFREVPTSTTVTVCDRTTRRFLIPSASRHTEVTEGETEVRITRRVGNAKVATGTSKTTTTDYGPSCGPESYQKTRVSEVYPVTVVVTTIDRGITGRHTGT